jgi:hypothetical protein
VVGGDPGFNLFINDMGAETADAPGNVGISFFHGSPDAPGVDIWTGGNTLFDDVTFGNFQGYLNVPAASYELAVTPANDNETILATYEADLAFWGGNTAVIFASGYLSGDDPAFEPWVALSSGGTFPLQSPPPPPAPTARLQVIHNSPTPTVDVYANGGLLLDDFAFRTATPYIDVPAGVELDLGVALANSTSASDAIANFPVTLEEGKTYIVVASGVVGGDPGFGLSVFDMGAESADAADNVGILFFHGSPDAPTVDIKTGESVLFDDVSFGEFSGYLNVPAGAYPIDVTPGADNSTIVASYNLDLGFWKGNTAVVFASGFLSGDDPAFEPWVALSTGGTFPLQSTTPPPPPAATAKVQVIHNSPSPTVDVYANDGLLLDDFAFRTATPFVEVPAGVELNLGVALSNSTSAADAIANYPVTLEAGKIYVVIANGIVGGTPGFGLSIFDMGEEAANDPANVGLLFFHGSPDAPMVDITAGGSPIFDDVSYGEFSGYLNVPAASYDLDVTPGADNSTIVASYTGDFSFWGGNTAVVFASGFLSGDDPAFEPWVALSNGGTFPLTARAGRPEMRSAQINNSINVDAFTVFPNPSSVQFTMTMELEEASDVQLNLFTLTGKLVQTKDLGNLDKGYYQEELNVSDLPEGQYFLQIQNRNEVVTKRIVVMR